MDATIRTLGQKPQLVNLAGVEVQIYPPSFYRLQEVIEAALQLPKAFQLLGSTDFGKLSDEADETKTLEILKECAVAFIGKSAVALRLICADREGNLPDELKDDDFWYKRVFMSEVIGLIDLFIELMDLEVALKKVPLLTGGVRQISRGRTLRPSSAKPSDGASTT